jgi:CTP-dependent riboflavin kinase
VVRCLFRGETLRGCRSETRQTRCLQWLEEEGVVARVFAGEGIRVSIAEPEGVDALLRVGARIVSDLQPDTSLAPLG